MLLSVGVVVGEGARFAFLGDFGEEVVALVIYEDEGGEIFNFDFPDGFHAEFGIFEQLDFLDGVLREHCDRSAYRAKVDASMPVACVCHMLGQFTLRYRHHKSLPYTMFPLHTAVSFDHPH